MVKRSKAFIPSINSTSSMYLVTRLGYKVTPLELISDRGQHWDEIIFEIHNFRRILGWDSKEGDL